MVSGSVSMGDLSWKQVRGCALLSWRCRTASEQSGNSQPAERVTVIERPAPDRRIAVGLNSLPACTDIVPSAVDPNNLSIGMTAVRPQGGPQVRLYTGMDCRGGGARRVPRRRRCGSIAGSGGHL